MTSKKVFLSIIIAGSIIASLAAGSLMPDTKVIKRVPTNHKVAALTFDDGPHPATTKQLLEVLKARQVRATFFVLGTSAERYPELLSEIAAAGQEIASHSYNHVFPNKLNKQEFYKEVENAERIIMSVAPKPSLYRPPGGGYNDSLVADLRVRGYSTILWTLDPRDWERRPAKQIFETVKTNIRPGAIILLHEGDCAQNTPEAVALIIDRLRYDGYQFITVTELLQYYEVRP